MKTQTCFYLGLWHPYKNAMESIWRCFLPTVIAPVFLKLFPKARCVAKPKLVTMQIMFSMLRYNYAKLKPQFKIAAERVSKNKTKSALLKSVQDFFEFYLPLVSHHCSITFVQSEIVTIWEPTTLVSHFHNSSICR